jgi:hypothetical protein
MATAQAGIVLRHIRELVAAEQAGDLPDRQLLEQFNAAHEEAAFAALVRRHGPLVLGVCRRVLGNAHDAEGAFQAAFLVLARKAHAIRKHESLGGWLYRVAFHAACGSAEVRFVDAKGKPAKARPTLELRVTPGQGKVDAKWLKVGVPPDARQLMMLPG